MHIAYDQLRLCFKQLLHPRDSGIKSFHAAKVSQIANVGRRVIQFIFGQAEGVLQFPAGCQHLSFETCRSEEGKRRVSARAADHVRFHFNGLSAFHFGGSLFIRSDRQIGLRGSIFHRHHLHD